MGKAKKRANSAMNQELQLPHLTGINLFKKQCNFQEFCLNLLQ